MGDVIKADFGGSKDKDDKNNPADNAANKPADVVEISPGVRKDEQSDVADSGERKESPNKRDLIKESIASIAKEFPVSEIGRLNKMTEVAKCISSLAGTNLSRLRAGSSYKDNIIAFQAMYSEGAKDELYGILEESSEEKWKKNPGYYLALLDVLRRQDILY